MSKKSELVWINRKNPQYIIKHQFIVSILNIWPKKEKFGIRIFSRIFRIRFFSPDKKLCRVVHGQTLGHFLHCVNLNCRISSQLPGRSWQIWKLAQIESHKVISEGRVLVSIIHFLKAWGMLNKHSLTQNSKFDFKGLKLAQIWPIFESEI